MAKESVRDRVVLITGASSGIGAATARAFAAEGAKLFLCARRLERLQEMEAELRSLGASEIRCESLDVTDREAVQHLLGRTEQAGASWLEIDVLVNNAGLSRGLGKLYQDDPTNWDEMLDTNVRGLLNVTRAVVPQMVERKRGHVVSLGSTAGHQTYAGGTVYCASKAAERVISEGLKLDLMGTPVRVTTIDPGMVKTDFSMVRFGGDQAKADKVYEDITPLEPEDVADAILWAVTRPARVNIHSILLTTIDQANSTTLVRRDASAKSAQTK